MSEVDTSYSETNSKEQIKSNEAQKEFDEAVTKSTNELNVNTAVNTMERDLTKATAETAAKLVKASANMMSQLA